MEMVVVVLTAMAMKKLMMFVMLTVIFVCLW